MSYSFFARTPNGFEFKVEVQGASSAEAIATAQRVWDDLNVAGYYLPARP